jgi:hypothetical protein
LKATAAAVACTILRCAFAFRQCAAFRINEVWFVC